MYKLLVSLVFMLTALAVSSESVNFSTTPNNVTVSGISAGAQMAHQLHLAYPEIFSGVGLIAGGPFGCAQGSLSTAMTGCMGSVNGEVPILLFQKEIQTAAQEGRLGQLSLLQDDRVWIFQGALDKTVAEELSEAVVSLYKGFIPTANIQYVNNKQAGHTFPTESYGNACSATKPPFLGNCAYDAAGEILQYLYGTLNQPLDNKSVELTEILLPGAVTAGLLETAYVYVPDQCTKDNLSCKVHLVLHGCGQSSAQLGNLFIEKSGYLRWAVANNIVLAFPQVAPSASNPLACWDWWGYTGPDYRWREGAQMKLLTQWLRKL